MHYIRFQGKFGPLSKVASWFPLISPLVSYMRNLIFSTLIGFTVSTAVVDEGFEFEPPGGDFNDVLAALDAALEDSKTASAPKKAAGGAFRPIAARRPIAVAGSALGPGGQVITKSDLPYKKSGFFFEGEDEIGES